MVCVQEGSQSVKGGFTGQKSVWKGGDNQVDIHIFNPSHLKKKKRIKEKVKEKV
jgi:hypothetical protein